MIWKKYIKGRKKVWKTIAKDKASLMVHPAAYCWSIVKGVNKYLGSSEETMVMGNIKGIFLYSSDMEEYSRMSKLVLRKIASFKFFDTIYLRSKLSIAGLQKYAKRINRFNLKDKSNQQLLDYYRKLFRKWIRANNFGHIINLTDFDTNLLSNKVQNIIRYRIDKNKLIHNPIEVFSILTSPNQRSTLQQKDLDFYGLVDYIQQNERKYRTASELIRNDKTFNKLLDKFVDNYDWVEFQYDGPIILSKKYFLDLIKSELKQGIYGYEKIQEILGSEKLLQAKQTDLEKKLQLSNEDKYWVSVARACGFLKGLRKDTVFCCSRLSDGLLSEIANRIKLNREQIRFVSIDEVKLLLNKELDINDFRQEVNKRKQKCVVFFTKNKLVIYSGKDAEEIYTYIYEEEADENISEIKGSPACVGNAKGKVKVIIVAKDINKMNHGDILVSHATNPNLLSAMKKASAIITDEGGLTCHASIVSRELGIPCIIGTKIATKILRDGDYVEVNANTGVITKLKDAKQSEVRPKDTLK